MDVGLGQFVIFDMLHHHAGHGEIELFGKRLDRPGFRGRHVEQGAPHPVGRLAKLARRNVVGRIVDAKPANLFLGKGGGAPAANLDDALASESAISSRTVSI